jgi:predicted DNA-binding ribbon-helix-helix protein
LSGHSTRTAVVTSRLEIADSSQLHTEAERRGTTLSALVARLVHEHAPQLTTTKADDDLKAAAA